MGTDQGANRDLLIVDDDADIREVLASFLESEGYSVHAVPNGQEALNRLRSGLRPFLILLDLATPVMSGWEFLVVQRRDPDLAAIPVVTLSAYGDIGPDAAALGVASCIGKPVDLGRLMGTIQAYCQAAE